MFLAKIFRNKEKEKNEHLCRESCSVDIHKLEEILEPTTNCCIYRVPQFLRKINEEAYSPRLISIGPLHYQSRDDLRGMENQKRSYLLKFCQRREIGEQKLEEFKIYIKNEERKIRDHYSVSSVLNSSDYVEMVLHDAVLILELLLRNYHETDDFLLKLPLKRLMQSDLLLLENQLPYFVLNDLYLKAFPANDRTFFPVPSFFNIFLKYVFEGDASSLPQEQPTGRHFTDFLRWILVTGIPSAEQSNENHIFDLPRATSLKKSGVKFTVIKEKVWRLGNIRFESRKPYGCKWLPWIEVNELKVPQIDLFYNKEYILRNLIAFEMFHYPTETLICHYAAIMDRLIDTERDVELLVEKGIIVNRGDYEAIAKMFNTLCSNIILSKPSCFNDVAGKLQAHYKYPWNHVKATLKRVYFTNLWTGTATVAAAFLLILTLIKTIYTIMQV